MKCGILVVGSLLWDAETVGRADWRNERLELEQQSSVTAPIYYGRKSNSRGGTFTMTFRRDGPSGLAIVVPCKRDIESIQDVMIEARALWKAEAPNSKSGAIASAWGSVGILFGNNGARDLLAADWSCCFKNAGGKEFSVVTVDGQFDIAWPTNADGTPVELDIILATATIPELDQPPVEAVADAWINQNGGYERYFIENVRNGIRTADDLGIWARIEKQAPTWLATADSYSEALMLLRTETAESGAG
ncbi:hypothetical protein [Phyllobacterium sp. SB3]|uniref:hypothetical protein n=1 Tax=Phyllobacterium sp. SB3 TaxID=3156073 RepID=UPI0032AEE501